MFCFTCSFVNQNIFGLNKKFNYRIMVQLPEHVRFALLRCQPEKLSGVGAVSPPREGKSFCKHLRRIYGICGITKYCSEGAGNSISFPTSAGEFHHELLQFLLITLVTFLPSQNTAESSLAFPSRSFLCLLQGTGMRCASHSAKPISRGPPEGSVSCRGTGDHRRRDGTKL